MISIRKSVDLGIDNLLTKVQKFTRSGALWFPEHSFVVPPESKDNVFAVLGTPSGKRVIPGSNIVTNDGDEHYGELGASETTTNSFGVLVLGTNGTAASKSDDFSTVTEISASEKSHDTGYPQTDDSDSDNTGTTGVDVVTYLTSYTKGDFSSSGIAEGCITNATPGTSEPLLTRYTFSSSFEKTSNDTLKVFTNHEFNGV